jgi:outer membrane protein assembly factor BamB
MEKEVEMKAEDLIFVGVKMSVVAIERATGRIVWESLLANTQMGGHFVNLFFDAGRLFAHTKGVLFCLDPATGRILWENPLKGYGYGLATFASATTPSSGVVAAIQELMNQEQASAAASSAAASS